VSDNVRELFEQMAPLLAPGLENIFQRRDLCILATRVAIETAAYFGVQASPLPVKVMAYNRPFARHVAERFKGVDLSHVAGWGDGSYSVGIGCGAPPRVNGWDGHLIAIADGWFGDFAIQQAERLQHNIVTGPALIGPYSGQDVWEAVCETTGTVIAYHRLPDDGHYRKAPDWKDPVRRRKAVGPLIRRLRQSRQQASSFEIEPEAAI
jgi:hypothetical protein